MTYLSHSKYGNDGQIRINNYYNEGTLTGCGSQTENEKKASTCDTTYGSNVSNYPQSTIGNIIGIFDTSGGCDDRVKGNYNSSVVEDDGFESFILEPKYYDLYTGDDEFADYGTTCNGGPCIGNANYETDYWYKQCIYEVNIYGPWVNRGGFFENYDKNTTIFQNDCNSGYDAYDSRFRLTITTY